MTPWTAARQAFPSFPILCSNSCLLSQWGHPIISSSVTFFSCPQSFPASWSFPVSQFYASSGQSIGVSASVLPVNIQGWFPWGLTSLIPLLSKGLSRVFSSTTVWKHQFFGAQPSLWFNSHISLWPHGWQHTRLPCLSLSPGICSNSCSLSQWCHFIISSQDATSSSATHFFCLQSFPASKKSSPFLFLLLFPLVRESLIPVVQLLHMPHAPVCWFQSSLLSVSPFDFFQGCFISSPQPHLHPLSLMTPLLL